MRDLSDSDRAAIVADMLRTNDERLKAMRRIESEIAELDTKRTDMMRRLEEIEAKANRSTGCLMVLLLLIGLAILLIQILK